MLRALLLGVLLLAFIPGASAQTPGPIDGTITLAPDAEPVVDAPAGLVRIERVDPGERYAFNLTLTREYTTFEVRARGFDIERPRQIVPTIDLVETEFPLFEAFPNDEIWDVDSPARVFYTNGTAADVNLRLGIPGPANVTLVLTRDVEPPAFVPGEVRDITHFSFYQETNTSELTIGDLQIRHEGSEEWIRNPTPVFHFRQRFPIQGLQPDSDVEARLIFTDWAGNEARSDVYVVRTAPPPIVPLPTVTPLTPAPNASLASGVVIVSARIESPESEVRADGVRLFFDKREVSQDLVLADNVATYEPREALKPGKHSVAFEVVNAAGGKAEARWTFEVARDATPLPAALAVLAVVLALGRRARS